MSMKKILEKVYRATVDKGINQARTVYYKEQRKSYGMENTDKTFYVIRRMDSYIGCGLFSHIITTVGSIKYAVENNMIPVVDMMNYPNLYISKNQLHKVNPWEYWFEQPMGYSISDIQHSKNIILGDGSIIEFRPDAKQPKETFAKWKEYMDKYVRIKPNIQEKMDREWNRTFSKSDRVLGVLCRGTDYISTKPKNHPIQPSVEMVIDKIDAMLIGGGTAEFF